MGTNVLVIFLWRTTFILPTALLWSQEFRCFLARQSRKLKRDDHLRFYGSYQSKTNGNDSCLLEMSSSWNFSVWANPSYVNSELSRAGLFNFRAETELKFFFRTTINFPNFLPVHCSVMIITNSNQLHDNFYEFIKEKRCFRKLNLAT